MKKIAFLLLLIAPMSVLAQKFAHFNSAEIIAVMPEYTAAQNELEKVQKQYAEEFKKLEAEFTKKVQEYQNEQANLPANIKERREKELGEMQQKAEQFSVDAQQQLQKLNEEKMAPIYQKLQETVNSVAKAGGYVYAFNVAITPIPYIDEAQSKNITNDIKTKMGISLSATPRK